MYVTLNHDLYLALLHQFDRKKKQMVKKLVSSSFSYPIINVESEGRQNLSSKQPIRTNRYQVIFWHEY